MVEHFLYGFKAALSGRYRRARRAAFVFAAGGARPGGGLKRPTSVRTSPAATAQGTTAFTAMSWPSSSCQPAAAVRATSDATQTVPPAAQGPPAPKNPGDCLRRPGAPPHEPRHSGKSQPPAACATRRGPVGEDLHDGKTHSHCCLVAPARLRLAVSPARPTGPMMRFRHKE